jgi:hypothetical protein
MEWVGLELACNDLAMTRRLVIQVPARGAASPGPPQVLHLCTPLLKLQNRIYMYNEIKS